MLRTLQIMSKMINTSYYIFNILLWQKTKKLPSSIKDNKKMTEYQTVYWKMSNSLTGARENDVPAVLLVQKELAN